jgi:hypothetical protein
MALELTLCVGCALVEAILALCGGALMNLPERQRIPSRVIADTNVVGDVVTALAFSPNDEEVTAATCGAILIWDADGRLCKRRIRVHKDDRGIRKQHGVSEDSAGVRRHLQDVLLCLDYSADGSSVVTGELGGAIRCWNVLTGDVRLVAQVYRPVYHIVMSSDGCRVIAGCRRSGGSLLGFTEADYAHLVEFELVRRSDKPKAHFYANREEDVFALRRISDGRIISGACTSVLSEASDGFLRYTTHARLADVTNKRTLFDPTKLPGRVQSMAISPDGALVAVSFSETGIDLSNSEIKRDGRVVVFNGHTGELVTTFATEQDNVKYVQFAPANRLLSGMTRDGHLIMWDLRSREKTVFVPTEGRLTCFAFSRDGKKVAGGTSNGTVVVWGL